MEGCDSVFESGVQAAVRQLYGRVRVIRMSVYSFVFAVFLLQNTAMIFEQPSRTCRALLHALLPSIY